MAVKKNSSLDGQATNPSDSNRHAQAHSLCERRKKTSSPARRRQQQEQIHGIPRCLSHTHTGWQGEGIFIHPSGANQVGSLVHRMYGSSNRCVVDGAAVPGVDAASVDEAVAADEALGVLSFRRSDVRHTPSSPNRSLAWSSVTNESTKTG